MYTNMANFSERLTSSSYHKPSTDSSRVRKQKDSKQTVYDYDFAEDAKAQSKQHSVKITISRTQTDASQSNGLSHQPVKRKFFTSHESGTTVNVVHTEKSKRHCDTKIRLLKVNHGSSYAVTGATGKSALTVPKPQRAVSIKGDAQSISTSTSIVPASSSPAASIAHAPLPDTAPPHHPPLPVGSVTEDGLECLTDSGVFIKSRFAKKKNVHASVDAKVEASTLNVPKSVDLASDEDIPEPVIPSRFKKKPCDDKLAQSRNDQSVQQYTHLSSDSIPYKTDRKHRKEKHAKTTGGLDKKGKLPKSKKANTIDGISVDDMFAFDDSDVHPAPTVFAKDRLDKACEIEPTTVSGPESLVQELIVKPPMGSNKAIPVSKKRKADKVPAGEPAKFQPGELPKRPVEEISKQKEETVSARCSPIFATSEESRKLRKQQKMERKAELLYDFDGPKREAAPSLRPAMVKSASAPPVPKKFFQNQVKDAEGLKKASYHFKTWSAGDDDELSEHTDNKPELTGSETLKKSAPESVKSRNPPTLTHVSKEHKFEDEDPYVALKVGRKHKDLFTVVRHVKAAYQCLQSGEEEDFEWDTEYLLSGLQEAKNLGSRCLSMIQLAQKSMEPSFRMYLRAHGTVTQIFSAVKDAPSSPTLSLCASLLMYILSRDHLKVDFDKTSLQLMLDLLDCEKHYCVAVVDDPLYSKHQERTLELCSEMEKRGLIGSHFKHERISAEYLAMETLLSMTSKKAGDWLKDALRLNNGIDYLLQTMQRIAKSFSEGLEKEDHVSALQTLARSFHVLENLSANNHKNQTYLVQEQSDAFFTILNCTFGHCSSVLQTTNRNYVADVNELPHDDIGLLAVENLISCLKVSLNVTGYREQTRRIVVAFNFVKTLFQCAHQLPKVIPESKQFDVQILALATLCNVYRCVVYSDKGDRVDVADFPKWTAVCINSLVKWSTICKLTQLFNVREEKAARRKNFEAELQQAIQQAQNQDKDDGNGGSQEEDFATMLQKTAGKHMEDSFVGAYAGVIIGVACQIDKGLIPKVQSEMAEKDFTKVIKLLCKFHRFMDMTSQDLGILGERVITDIIAFFETLPNEADGNISML